VLYGAGNTGRHVLARLREAGIEPAAFADDTPEKQGSSTDGLPVASPVEAVRGCGGRCALAVTMLNAALPFSEARRRLAGVTEGPLVSVFDLARAVPHALLPFNCIEPARDLLARSREIRDTARLLEWDPDSLEQLLAHLRFRLELDFDALPPPTVPAYFPAEVLASLPAPFRFVDCGAYDGDTIRELIALRPDVDRIVAFEPDRAAHARLESYVASLPTNLRSRIDRRPEALGRRAMRASFVETGDTSARIAAEGEHEVQVSTLDATIDLAGAPLYVKLDVEGAEADVLDGAQALLGRTRPHLAVSVYHRPGDLWEIARDLAALDLGYRFLLRTHGVDGADLVLYAISGSAALPHGR
jgi:FkbM family methyltransferase